MARKKKLNTTLLFSIVGIMVFLLVALIGYKKRGAIMGMFVEHTELHAKAQAALQAKDYREASKQYLRAINYSKKDIQQNTAYRMEFADLLVNRVKNEEDLTSAEKAEFSALWRSQLQGVLRQDPDNTAACWKLFDFWWAYRHSGHSDREVWANIIDVSQTALEQDPANPEIYIRRSVIYSWMASSDTKYTNDAFLSIAFAVVCDKDNAELYEDWIRMVLLNQRRSSSYLRESSIDAEKTFELIERVRQEYLADSKTSASDESKITRLEVSDLVELASAGIGDSPVVDIMKLRMKLLGKDYDGFDRIVAAADFDQLDGSEYLIRLSDLLVARSKLSAANADEYQQMALGYIEKAMQLDSDNLRTYTKASALMISMGLFDRAEQVCRNGLEVVDNTVIESSIFDPKLESTSTRDSSRIELNLNLAQLYLAKFDQTKDSVWKDKLRVVIAELDSMAETILPPLEKGLVSGRDSMQIRAATYKALLARQDGDEFTAMKLLRKVYDLTDGANKLVGGHLVDLYLRHQQDAAAMGILEKMLLREPDNVPLLVQLARLQLNARQMQPLSQTLDKLGRLELTAEQSRRVQSIKGRVGVMNQEQIATLTVPETIPAELIEYWLENAGRMQAVGEPEQAEKIYQKLISEHPGNSAVVGPYVLMLLNQDNRPKALDVVDAGLQASPDSKSLVVLKDMLEAPPEKQREIYIDYIKTMEDAKKRNLLLAEAYRRRGDEGDQQLYCEYLEKVVELDPEYGDAFDRLFDARLQAGQLDEARKLLDKAAEFNIHGVDGNFHKARLQTVEEDYSGALDTLAAVLAKREYFSDAYTLQGQIYHHLGRLDEARDSYEKAWSQNNTNMKAVIGLARIADSQGHREEHKKWIDKAWPLSPMNEYVRGHWLEYHFEDASPQQFIKDCGQVVKRYPNDTYAKQLLARAYEKLTPPNLELAEAIYRELYTSATIKEERLRYLGTLLGFFERRERFDDAFQLLDEAQASDDDIDPLALNLLRVGLLRVSGRLGESRQLLKQLLESEPENLAVLQSATRWALQTGADWNLGLQAIEKQLELSPDNDLLKQARMEMQVRASQIDAAEAEIRQYLQENPESASAMALMAQVQLTKGNTEQAMKACLNALRLDPDQVNALLLRSELYSRQGKLDLSMADIEKAYSLNPSVDLAVRMAARAYQYNPDGVRSREILSSALDQFEDSIVLMQTLAQYQLKTMDWAGLENTLRLARGVYPQKLQWFVIEARMWSDRGDYPRQVTTLEQALALSKDANILLEFEYLQALLNAGSYQQVIDRAPKIEAANVQLSCRLKAYLGRAQLGLQQSEAGLATLHEAMATAPTPTDVLVVLAHLKSGAGSQAEEILTNWLASDKKVTTALALANIKLAAGNAGGAIATLESIDTSESNIAFKFEVVRSLGVLHYDGGNNEKAKQYYEKALEFNPNSETVLNNLAYLLSDRMGDHQGAIDYAVKAAELSPSDPNIADTLGWIYFQAGKLDKAESELQRAMGIKPIPAAFYHLGRVYESRGDMAQAKHYYSAGFDLVRGDSSSDFYDEFQEKLSGM